MTAPETVRAAMSFGLDDVVARHVKDTGRSPQEAGRLVFELKRFLILAGRTRSVGMAGPVDEMWHTFLLFSEKYAEFCELVAGGPIHHVPAPDRGQRALSDAAPELVAYAELLADYRALFGSEPPADVWPRPPAPSQPDELVRLEVQEILELLIADGALARARAQAESTWEDLEAVAAQVEREWGASGRRLEAFPEVACAALAGLLARPALSVPSLLQALAARPHWPDQFVPHTRFGQPSITLLSRPDWHLDMLHWLHPMTAIHDHGFRGAFAVASGLSLESVFEFQSSSLRPGVQLGELRRTSTALLQPGTVRPIGPRSELIHAVHHLAVPTVSFVVRTSHETALPVQREYFLPGLSVPTRQSLTPARQRKLDLVQTLALTQPELAVQVAAALVEREDDVGGFWLLFQLLVGARLDVAPVARVLDRARTPLAEWREPLLAALRATRVWSMDPGVAPSGHHRLLVALAGLGLDRDELRGLLREYSPHEPGLERWRRWVDELVGRAGPRDVVAQLEGLVVNLAPVVAQRLSRDRP